MMSFSMIPSFNYPLQNSESYFLPLSEMAQIRNFLNMDLATLLSKGIPVFFEDFIILSLERLNERFSHLEINCKTLSDLMADMKICKQGWKRQGWIYYEKFIFQLLLAFLSLEDHKLEFFDKQPVVALIEKIIMLYAEWIGKKWLHLEIGNWNILEVDHPEKKIKTFRVVYHPRKDVWGMGLFAEHQLKVPWLIHPFPFHINVLSKFLDAIEKNEKEEEISGLLSELPSLGRYFFSDLSGKKLVDQMGIFFEFYFDFSDPNFIRLKDPSHTNLKQEDDIFCDLMQTGCFKEMERSSLPKILVSAIFYLGPLDFNKEFSHNGTEILFSIDPVAEVISLYPSKEAMETNPLFLNTTQEILEELKTEHIRKLIESFSLGKHGISCSLYIPKTEKEWKIFEYRFFLELLVKAKDEPEIIFACAEALEIEIPDQEFLQFANKEEKEELDKTGEVDLSSTTLIKVLADQTRRDSLFLKQQEQEKNNQITKEEQYLTTVAKTSRNVKGHFKGKKKASLSNNDKISEQESQITSSFTTKEKMKMQSVLEGNPMPSKEFNKLAIQLLKKKLGAQVKTIKENQKNSHPVLRFIKSNGTQGGLTLSIKHGSKDAVAKIHHQKRTLKDILGFHE